MTPLQQLIEAAKIELLDLKWRTQRAGAITAMDWKELLQRRGNLQKAIARAEASEREGK